MWLHIDIGTCRESKGESEAKVVCTGTEERKVKLTPVRASIKENGKESDLGRGWKPVIGGKLQGLEDRAQMQGASAGGAFLSPSPKQTSSEKSKSVSETPASSEQLTKEGNLLVAFNLPA